MAEGDDTQLKFAELRTAIKNEDYELSLTLSTKMAKLLPEDTDITKCKCVSLMHLGRFEDALKESHIPSLEFEKAYCLYQLSRLSESLKIIRQSLKNNNGGNNDNDNNPKMKCLEAQVLYKLAEFSKASDTYQSLIHDDYKELEGSELLSNTLAAYAQTGSNIKGENGRGLEGISKLSKSSPLLELIKINDSDYQDPDKSYELAYNTACAYINNNKFHEAYQLLELSQRRLKEHLLMEEKDNMQEEEATTAASSSTSTKSSTTHHHMTEEEASISTQLAYVLLKLNAAGSVGAAKAMMYCMKVLKSIDQNGKGKPTVAKAVCTNNLAVIRRDKELPDSLKRLDNVAVGIESKLTEEQHFTIKFNYCLILLQLDKIDECRSELETLQKEFPTYSKIPILLICLDLKINHQGQFSGTFEEISSICQSLDHLTENIKSNKDNHNVSSTAVTEIMLVKAQFLLQMKDYENAVSALLQCEDNIIYKPGTMATLIDVYERFLSNPIKINEILEKSLLHYRQASESSESESSNHEEFLENKMVIMMAVAGRRLMNGEFEMASELYQELLDSQDLDSETRLNITAHLILSKSWTSPEEAEKLTLDLPSFVEDHTSAAGSEDADLVEDAATLESSCHLPRNNRVRRLVVVDRAAARAERKDQGETVSVGSKKRSEKRRKEYLAKLAMEGKYDPLRPTNPDPERWIAKKLRSYNRRKGKKGASQKYSGAQGTSSEAANKDAAKLDAYARAQAKKNADLKAAEEPAGNQKRGPYRRLK
mmetsp:Transcript_51696/g.66213  ORF Transcript_51696/g.66213 Transcript_51696/m.66213 type:complete len:767 (+) Transcript_51696:24-2324(+)